MIKPIAPVAPGILFLCLRLVAAVTTCDLEALNLAYGQPTSCKTCFLPTVGHENSLNPSDYPKVDLSDNWLYFAGDSTLRQLYGEFYGIIHRSQAMSYTELKHHSRQDCPDQPRDPYVPPPWDDAPCYLNEKTCQTHYEESGMGSNITLTYDWKHFIYEDFDRYLFDHRWREDTNRPQWLFVSPGVHDCFHDPNGTEHHALQLEHLAEHLSRLNLRVVWIDSNPITRSGFGDNPWESSLKCSFYVNDVSQRVAEKYGLLFFSRHAMVAVDHVEGHEWPMHHADTDVKVQVDVLLAWLGCWLANNRF